MKNIGMTSGDGVSRSTTTTPFPWNPTHAINAASSTPLRAVGTKLEADGSMQALFTRVMALDLDKVRARLIAPTPYSFDSQRADRAIESFKRFFFLTGVEKPPLVPSPDIDAVWHEFLMFTREYASSCSDLFGKFVHHEPTSNGDLLKPAFDRTKELFQQYFGVGYVTSSSSECCDGDSCHTCRDQTCCSTDNGGGGL